MSEKKNIKKKKIEYFFSNERCKHSPPTNTHLQFTTLTQNFHYSHNIMSGRTFSAQQQANFANNSDPEKGISLCIPRVFNNIGWRRIKRHMIEANLGYVERVDVIPVTKFGETSYKRAFVHFAPGKWNMRDPTARQALEILQRGDKIKLEYEAPWFWLVGISGAKKPDEAPKPRERTVKIDLKPTASAESKSDYKLDEQPDEEMRGEPAAAATAAAAAN